MQNRLSNLRLELNSSKVKVFFILLLIFFLAICSINYIYSNNLNGPPIRSDGFGYYAYLPAVFIDRDLSFETLAEKSFNGEIPSWTGIQIYAATNKYLNKYTVGTAILQIPFFAAADILSKIFAYQTDGYSDLYQIGNIISGLFYLLLGLFFLHKILKQMTGESFSLLIILLVTFGTNLFHYASYDASFSHIYSFSMITLFIYLILDNGKSYKRDIFLGLLLGIITMVRVTNIIIIIFYIFYDIKSINDFRNRFFRKNYYYHFILVFVSFIIAFLPQLLYWNYTTGHFLVNSYQGEGFDWFSPHLFNFLFSIKKGLFFWTPLWLFAVAGIFLMSFNNMNSNKQENKNRGLFLPLIIYHPLQLYICSSWSSWDYGGSFGQRPYADIASILAISLAVFLYRIFNMKNFHYQHGISKNLLVKSLISALIIIFLILNILLMLGYWNQKIPYSNTTLKDIQETFIWYSNMIFKK